MRHLVFRRCYGLLLVLVMFSCHAGVHDLAGDNGGIFFSDSKGRKIIFTPADTPVFDFKNGYLSVSVTDNNLDMIQVNGINTDDVKIVYIKTKDGKSFFSDKDRSRVRSKVKAADFTPGNPVQLSVRTRVYDADEYYHVTVHLKGIIPAETNVIINE